jgi:hypothetical protein
MAGVVVQVLEGPGHDLGGDEIAPPAYPSRPVPKSRNGVGDGLSVGVAESGRARLGPIGD